MDVVEVRPGESREGRSTEREIDNYPREAKEENVLGKGERALKKTTENETASDSEFGRESPPHLDAAPVIDLVSPNSLRRRRQ